MATLTPLVEVQDLADWVGEPITEATPDFKRAEMCIRIASALVRREARQTWVSADGILLDVPEDAVMVTLYCASRVYDNREAQTRAGIDDHDASFRVDESGAYLTASERRLLSSHRARTGGLSTVATTRSDNDVNALTWVPTDTAGVYFPWY